MLKAVVTGATGKMGGRIINAIDESQGIELSGAVERADHPVLGKDVGEVIGLGKKGVEVAGDIDKVIGNADVIIDFTTPEISVYNLEVASKNGAAIVIGTTGFSSRQREMIKGFASKTRCVMAPNMSVGINLLFMRAKEMAKVLGEDYDVEIIEAHHKLKKDAPSGTAMRLAEILATALRRDLDKVAVYKRKGITGERKKEEIGIQSIRAGDIVGDHTLLFGGIGERLEITHRAHNRDTFARGAVRAAKWIVNQKNGIYDMMDVLGLR
ncbi:MAG: 4-hydroxy-tetrahydrodipicolinate reductase [Thermodesulfobacteriota bacterium]